MQPSAYQESRQQLLAIMDRLREVRDDLTSRDPIFINGLPVDVRQKMHFLDRESTRLRNPDLTIAFVGGFNAGKSSLVNALLGRYLLPEAAKVTTAVPTFVRTTSDGESAELHYLNEAEVDKLDDLYRAEIASLFPMSDLASEPFSTLLEKVKPLAAEGRGGRLVDQFQLFQELRRTRQVDARGGVVDTSISKGRDKICDENEAMFLDRVVLKIHRSQIPEDVVLVDLPGVAVSNPRHRKITFRFVEEEAHALIFVLNSTAIFNKDDKEIMERVRSGESGIAEKTFWVLNRWDSLTAEGQRQTIADFENTMREFAIPSGFQSFRTNALHGLLAQLALRGEAPQDLAVQRHMKDYDDSLAPRYGGNHQTAFRDSQIPMLQQHVLTFLNDRLRRTTLRSAYDNARANFCDPLPHHLRHAQKADDTLLNGDLNRQEKEASRERVEERCAQRKAAMKMQLKEMRGEVAEKRSTILASKTEELLKELGNKIAEGSETDAYAIYLEIMTESELRRYPYHLEIEMRIVDKLNTMLKREFREIVRNQARDVCEEYAKRVHDSLEMVRNDVNYNSQIMAPFEEALDKGRSSFCSEVDGHVKILVGEFDKLLVYLPWTWSGNPILIGLEKAAKSGSKIINNPNEPIMREHFQQKTRLIRQTLKDHYIQRVREEHNAIARNIPMLIINNLQEIERRLLEIIENKYRPALEIIMAQKVEGEFSTRKKGIEERSRRFRNTIEQIEQLSNEMTSVVADGPE